MEEFSFELLTIKIKSIRIEISIDPSQSLPPLVMSDANALPLH